ncbi:MAG TPA: TetR/AcrR family transcriptional regulator [Solirubrobacterales bacterium]|nr:TetR/AcrR family transcriptional regulator [Solirubrobacterales bacterium]
MARRESGTDDDGKLRRLPPGRHGLSREFVTRNQRERLIAGTIAAVSAHGFRETSVSQIAAAAGVSRRTFYGYFSTKEECFEASFDLFEGHLLGALAEAGDGARGFAAAVRARVATLLEFLAANPDLVRFGLVAPPGAGGEFAARGRRFLAAVVGELTEGHPAPRRGEAATALETEAMQGAISSVLIAAVAVGDGEELPAAAPQLVEMVLAPFLGRRRAGEESRKV